jgi:hypothetical protein
MMELRELQLKVFYLPCTFDVSEELESVYRLWKKLWTESYIEMGKEKLLTSDTFTRQHEILAIYYQGQPIASVCHRYANLSLESTYEDSYFKNSWSAKEIDYLKSLKGSVLLGSQISVDKNFRNAATGMDLKRLISFVSLKHAQNRGVNVILGMMRVNRGMEKVFIEAGGNILAQNRDYFDVKVDLIAFFPKIEPVLIPDPFSFQVEYLLKSGQFLSEVSLDHN